jgi:hypothetical protein
MITVVLGQKSGQFIASARDLGELKDGEQIKHKRERQ